MIAWSEANEEQGELQSYALLFLFSYSFLLRTPSEALPAIAGEDGREEGSNAILFIEGGRLVLVLRRRKNRPQGSRLARKCTCQKSATSCAYHRLGPLLEATPVGAPVFGGLTANGVHASR